MSNNVVRILTLISGVLGLIIPNVGSWGLSLPVQSIITLIGGALLSTLAFLEHPTMKTYGLTGQNETQTSKSSEPLV